MKGIYQHCSEEHLARYLPEFAFRYSNRAALGVDDTERAIRAIKGAAGERLASGGLVTKKLKPESPQPMAIREYHEPAQLEFDFD
jgi:hypothetical protein